MKSPQKDRRTHRGSDALLTEMKSALARALRRRRAARGLSQAVLARLLGSSQSRVSRIEAGDPEVSLELLVRALSACGTTRRDIGRTLGGGREH
jgi:transcriptional regulator with XRE-family HTH domain